MNRDLISINGIELDCVVGVHPHERNAPQRLEVDISICIDTEAAGIFESITRTVDYQMVASQVIYILQYGRFRLLESAAHVLAGFLLCPPMAGDLKPQVISAEIRLRKPGALDGIAVPSLTIRREADWTIPGRDEYDYGSYDSIHKSGEVYVGRLNIAPEATVKRICKGSFMVLGEGLLYNNEKIAQGTIISFREAEEFFLRNISDNHCSVLIIEEHESRSA